MTLLGLSGLTGTVDRETPALLLAIEPWFLIGGIAYGAMVLEQRRVSVPGQVRSPHDGLRSGSREVHHLSTASTASSVEPPREMARCGSVV